MSTKEEEKKISFEEEEEISSKDIAFASSKDTEKNERLCQERRQRREEGLQGGVRGQYI